MGHALMENRHGLADEMETTLATGTAEREAGNHDGRALAEAGTTLGANRVYDTAGFVRRCVSKA